jgi:twinkle protein
MTAHKRTETTIIGDSACPQCVAAGKDSTANHLILFSDGSSYCNRCHYCEHAGTFTHTSERSRRSPVEVAERIEEILTCPIRALSDRGINREVAEHFGVRVGLSQEDGQTLVSHYYPRYVAGNLVGFKTRLIEGKKFWQIKTSTSTPDLFGANVCNKRGKKLFITEGECDAMALYQILTSLAGPAYAHLHPSVVSVPDGASSIAGTLAAASDLLDGYDTIVLVPDQDAAGKSFVSAAARIIPVQKIRVASFSEKDPNDMLRAGKLDELKWAVLTETKPYRPTSIVTVDDIMEDAMRMPEWGLSWPWPTLTKLTYGIRPEGYGFAAAPKIGKTEAFKQIQQHLVCVHGEKIATFMLEEAPHHTAKIIAGKLKGKQFHKPDGNFTQEELRDGLEALRDKIFFYNHFGFKDWEEIKETIRILVAAEEVRHIFIDPLTALVSKLSASEANDELNKVMTDLASMSQELQFTYYYTSHLNPPKTGKPHERGGKVHESQLTGSRAMTKWSHYIIGIERNKDPELSELERNRSTFVLLCDRVFGNVGQFPVYYNKETGAYLEMVESVPQAGGF